MEGKHIFESWSLKHWIEQTVRLIFIAIPPCFFTFNGNAFTYITGNTNVLINKSFLVKEVPCLFSFKITLSRSQRPRGLRRGSVASRLLRWWVRSSRGAWMPVFCDCCVLSGRGLCDELITRPEKSYWLWCVVWFRNLVNEEVLAHWGCYAKRGHINGSVFLIM